MNKQIIISPGGERLVVLPEADYERLLEAAEDAADIAAGDAARGEESVPAELVNRLIDEPQNRLRIWREYRKLSLTALAEATGLSIGYLSEIETGKKTGSVAALRKIAAALDVGINEIIAQPV